MIMPLKAVNPHYKEGRRKMSDKPTYTRGPNGYALYFHKSVWKESASVKNDEVEQYNKPNNKEDER